MAKTKVREILKSDESKKEKFSYMWHYYRWHLLTVLVALGVGIFLLQDWLNRPVTYFHVAVLAPEVDLEEEEPLAEEITTLLQPEGMNETVFVSFTPHGQLAERFVAQLSAAEYDLLLMDESSFEQYAEFKTMQPFRLSNVDQSAYYHPDAYNEPIGIHASQVPQFEAYETTSDLILMIPQNAQRQEQIRNFFEAQGLDLEFAN
ncbi:hypothetical protein ADIAL_0419 [Alkalibacterium sp. AK22]|uniref:hypothetical protein n=1 Tax=Alkalibacterium sp. AK22 TaxID=1229520 RepID=UPI000450D17C|nr:hypothetical protein [Alkalibacterium sp. AK22]EXJ24108.1 hypothetical protein ADIAL_0419 [Alkalibacterium sp. AK22]